MKINWVSVCLGIIAIVLCFFLFKTCNNQKEAQNFLSAANDSLHKTTNKLGQEVTTTKLLYGSIEDLKAANQNIRDSAIIELNKIVDKNTLSATVLSNQTLDKGASKTTIVYLSGKTPSSADTCKNYIFPEYKTHWNTRWDTGYVIANKDSIIHNVLVKNEFDIQQEFVSGGFLKPMVPVVIITNKNPNTLTKELKTFTVKPKPSNRLIWFGAGAGSMLIGAILLHIL